MTIPSGLDQRIDFYHRYTRCGLEFGSRQPGRYHRIMYEELVNSPEEVVRSLMEWLGEPFEQLQLAFNAVHHEVGLEDPKVASTDHVHACSVGRWRDVLTKGEAAQILSACVELWREIDPDSLHTGWTADDLSALSVS